MSLSEVAKRLGINSPHKSIRFTGCSTDSRTVQPGNLFIALRGEKFDGHAFIHAAVERGACAALVDRSVAQPDLPLLIVDDTKQAMATLAHSWRKDFAIPLLAVTGSNGKTTVKEMIHSVLGMHALVLATQGNLNNDIGVPLTLFRLGSEHQYAVIEMGANHPGEIALLSRMAGPHVAVITQCAPAHLEGFGSVDGVARAKSEIYGGLLPGGTAVINADDHYAGFWREAAAGLKQISFGIVNEADVTATDISFDHETGGTHFVLATRADLIKVSLPLAGRHNVMNALAAAACCLTVGIPINDIRDGLARMHHVHGRMEMMVSSEGARIFDDTYNANPASLKAGLEVLSARPGRHWLVLGDMGELGSYTEQLHHEAGETAREYGVERLFALGQSSRFSVDGFGQGAVHYDRIEDLLRALRSNLGPDVTVLVKGSRFMAMDRVVKSLMEKC